VEFNIKSVDELIKDFNLFVTTERGFEGTASSDLWIALREIGDEKPVVDRGLTRGSIVAKTSFDPVEAVNRLRGELSRHPMGFRWIYRIIPIERTVSTGIQNIVETATELSSRVREEDSYRITVEKRRTNLRSREVIEAVAAGIDRRVDLENPDWVILIEIFGKITGISVVNPKSILNIQKELAESSTSCKESPPLDDERG